MQEAARVYAEALFDVAREKGKLDAVRGELAQFADAVDGNRELQVFFFSPYFSSAEKVTRKALDSEDHKRLIEEALEEVDFSALAGNGTGKEGQ